MIRARELVPALALVLCATHASAETYYVATTGDDAAGDGSASSPWASVDHALGQGIGAEGGHTVLVGDGTYEGDITVSRGFAQPVLVQAEHPYQVTLTNVTGGIDVLRIYVAGSANLTFEGFIFTNDDPGYLCSGREGYFIIHIQDASDVTLRNNIIHGATAAGRCNELLKINRGSDTAYPRNILVQGNLFYDQVNAGGADMIDSVRPGEIDIVENIFWGEPGNDESQSFITLKRQAPAPAAPRSPRYQVSRNVFLSWGGKTDQAFVQFGEDGVAEIEIEDALVENNLILGDSPAQLAAPFQFKGAANITVRANTVVGDLPSGSFGFRIGTEGDNPQLSDFFVYNNIFADPTGTMGTRLINTYGDVVVASIALEQNLYFNAGAALPTDGSVTPADDPAQVVGDPLLPTDQSAIALPRWDRAAGAFPSGTTSIRQEFLRLVETYAALGDGSPAINAADATNMPAEDVRGHVRDANPDIGCYEYGASGAAGAPGSNNPGASGAAGAPGSAPNYPGGTSASLAGSSGTNPAVSSAAAADDGGCGCRVISRKVRHRSSVAAWLALALLPLARRRRH